MCFQGFSRVAFSENALFKSSGIICQSPLPSSLSNDLLMDKGDRNGFFSTQRVCMSSDSSHSMTDSSLNRDNCQASWLSSALTADMALLAHVVLLHIAQSRAMCILVVTLLILWLHRLALVVCMVDVLQ